MAVCSSGLYAQSTAKPAPDPKATSDQQDVVALSQLVDGVAAGQAAPSDIRVSWLEDHQIKSQGETVYVPFSFSVDRAQLASPAATVYVRAVSKATVGTTAIQLPGTRPTHPWERQYSIDLPADGKVSRAMALAPGTYQIYVGVKEKGAAKMGLAVHELVVPVLGGTELTTSSIILAPALDSLPAPLAPEKQEENPFVIGTLKITPSTGNVFAKTGEMQVLFWIYNAAPVSGKPDVQVEMSFHAKQPDGSEKYFNKIEPKAMNEKAYPADFKLAQGDPLMSVLGFSLASFPVGGYRLEIKITDKPSGKEITRNVNFQVAAS